jgi:hypothetical protein
MTRQPNSPQPGQQRQAGSQSGAQSGTTRQQQQFDAGEGGRFADRIQPRMEVIGADGAHVGKVERVEGSRLRLDPQDWQGSERGTAHYLPLDQVGSIEGSKVRLTLNAERATGMATTH